MEPVKKIKSYFCFQCIHQLISSSCFHPVYITRGKNNIIFRSDDIYIRIPIARPPHTRVQTIFNILTSNYNTGFLAPKSLVYTPSYMYWTVDIMSDIIQFDYEKYVDVLSRAYLFLIQNDGLTYMDFKPANIKIDSNTNDYVIVDFDLIPNGFTKLPDTIPTDHKQTLEEYQSQALQLIGCPINDISVRKTIELLPAFFYKYDSQYDRYQLDKKYVPNNLMLSTLIRACLIIQKHSVKNVDRKLLDNILAMKSTDINDVVDIPDELI